MADWVSTAIGLDTAQEFWNLLLPHGLSGGALTGKSTDDTTGWQERYNQWWSEFLAQKGSKGVSKDTWTMVSITTASQNGQLQTHFKFLDFVRSIDAKFSTHDIEGRNDNEVGKRVAHFLSHSKAPGLLLSMTLSTTRRQGWILTLVEAIFVRVSVVLSPCYLAALCTELLSYIESLRSCRT